MGGKLGLVFITEKESGVLLTLANRAQYGIAFSGAANRIKKAQIATGGFGSIV